MSSKTNKKSVIILIIRIIFIIAGVFIFGLYVGPLASLGVFNAGNAFGFIMSAVFLALGIFWNPITNGLANAWQSGKAGKAVLSIICALLVVFFSAFFITLPKIVKASKYTASNQVTVIVLGCQIRGDVPSSTLKARCEAAADYLKKNPNAVAIATGGQGSDENLSEGRCIYNLLTRDYGIDGGRVYVEEESKNTGENIANAEKIIADHGFSTEVAIATSEYHEYRASIICGKNGLEAYSIPSKSSKAAKPTFFTREVFAVWAQYL